MMEMESMFEVVKAKVKVVVMGMHSHSHIGMETKNLVMRLRISMVVRAFLLDAALINF